MVQKYFFLFNMQRTLLNKNENFLKIIIFSIVENVTFPPCLFICSGRFGAL